MAKKNSLRNVYERLLFISFNNIQYEMNRHISYIDWTNL